MATDHSTEWDVIETAGFGTTHYYTRSTDAHGHRDTIRADVPRGWAAQIAEFVHSSDIPEFKSGNGYGAFVRASILFFLQHLEGQKDKLRDPQVMAWARSQRLDAERAMEQQRVAEAEATLKAAEEILGEFARMNDKEGVERELARVREQAGGAVNEYYQRRMWELVDRYDR